MLRQMGTATLNRPTTFKKKKDKGADHQWQQLTNVPTTLSERPTSGGG
jgi:hypothetical protein